MKRNVFGLVLIFVITLTLCSCGSTAVEDNNSSSSNNTVSESKSVSDKSETEDINKTKEEIKFTPSYVAVDDNNITLEVTSVSSEIFNVGTSEEFVDYSVNFTIINKNEEYDAQVYITADDAGIGAYTVQFSNSQTSVRAGKINETAAFTCQVYKEKEGHFVAEGSEHIESLEDLLSFNARVDIDIYEDTGSSNKIVERYNEDISLEDAQY